MRSPRRLKVGTLVASVVILCGALAWLLFRDRGLDDDSRSLESRSGAAMRPDGLSAPTTRASVMPQAITPLPFDPRWELDPRPFDGRADDPFGSIVVHVVWQDDDTPAAGVGVHVVERGSRSGMRKESDWIVGTDGSVTIARVIAGSVAVSIDRGGSSEVVLGAGTQEDITIAIPSGRTVVGTIVDPEGNPVANADIWTWESGKRREGARVARSDEKGEFSVRSVSPSRYLGAREASHAPSSAVRIGDGPKEEVVSVKLELGGPPGSIVGFVARPDGSPIPGATVQAEPEWGAGSSLANVVTADESGVFRIDGLQPGGILVVVRMDGFVAWESSVSVRPGEATRVSATIARGAVVTGVVKNQRGSPIAGAVISVGHPTDVRRWKTKSSAEGSFRLEGVPAGSIEIRASVIEDLGKADATLECEDGAVLHWSPVLELSPRIEGFLVDERGQPLPEWTVDAWLSSEHTWLSSEGPTHWKSTNTDARGWFEFRGCADGHKYRLEARPWAWHGVRHVVEGIEPGDDEHVVRVDLSALVRVRGRVLGPDGKPEAAHVVLRSSEDTQRAFAESATGRFLVGPMMPGRWRTVVSRVPAGAVDLGDREILPGNSVDLGDIRLPKCGRLVLELSDPSEIAGEAEFLLVQSLGTPEEDVPFSLELETLDSPMAVGPGKYTVVILFEETRQVSPGFEIVSGQETRVRVTLEPPEPK